MGDVSRSAGEDVSCRDPGDVSRQALCDSLVPGKNYARDRGVSLARFARDRGLSEAFLRSCCRSGRILGARKHPLTKKWWIYPPAKLVLG